MSVEVAEKVLWIDMFERHEVSPKVRDISVACVCHQDGCKKHRRIPMQSLLGVTAQETTRNKTGVVCYCMYRAGNSVLADAFILPLHVEGMLKRVVLNSTCVE